MTTSDTRKRINLIESINQVVSAEPNAHRIARLAMRQIQEMHVQNTRRDAINPRPTNFNNGR